MGFLTGVTKAEKGTARGKSKRKKHIKTCT